MLPEKTFEGRTGIITGGATGIGFAIAREVARLGGRVVLASRKEEKLTPAVEQIRSETGRADAAHFHVLDVRDDNEWTKKHIPGALHTYVGHVEESIPQLPKDSELVVHCSVGHRAGLAASILERSGFTNVYNMLGGLCAWEALGLPLEKPDKAN